MLHLILVRHAKSSWDDPGLADFARPLNNRGMRDAPLMAARMKQKQITPALMITSPATRATTTCRIFAAALQYDESQIESRPSLYHASASTILEVVAAIDNVSGPVLLFGHNPGLTYFVNDLVEADIDNIPTCGVVSCFLEIASWKDARWNCGHVDFIDYPKRSM